MRWIDGLATLVVVAVCGTAATARADSHQDQSIHTEVMRAPLTDVALFRGAPSKQAFAAGRLEPVSRPEDLVRAIGSRLISSSSHVTGLTNCPQTAGCFALGVKDGQASSVRILGASEGYVGVTRARAMPAARFVELLDRHRTSLPTLLDVMGECNVVVDAGGLTSRLADRYPGIITSGFREMIGAALDRESEYLAFGRKPSFQRVVKVNKADVIREGDTGVTPHFNPALARRLKAPVAQRTKPADSIRRGGRARARPGRWARH